MNKKLLEYEGQSNVSVSKGCSGFSGCCQLNVNVFCRKSVSSASQCLCSLPSWLAVSTFIQSICLSTVFIKQRIVDLCSLCVHRNRQHEWCLQRTRSIVRDTSDCLPSFPLGGATGISVLGKTGLGTASSPQLSPRPTLHLGDRQFIENLIFFLSMYD